ncbi:MAG: nickel-dependent lactate racemase, partial [Actinobacteria bacterium]|nr:nickel-dependent lactate racemase [Actinomycetota bacterium]
MYFLESDNKHIRFLDKVENVAVTLDQKLYAGVVLECKEPPAIGWPQDYRSALEKPIGCKPLREMAKGRTSVSIIVSDSTRKVPTARLMPFVIDEVKAGGIEIDQIVVVVATGVHRPATDTEIYEIVGHEFCGKLRVISHDPYSPDKLVSLGYTSRGTPVEVNRGVGIV